MVTRCENRPKSRIEEDKKEIELKSYVDGQTLILWDLNSFGKIKEIEVYDLSGRPIYQQQLGRGISEERIQVSSNGMYVLRLNTEQGLIVKKFFI